MAGTDIDTRLRSATAMLYDAKTATDFVNVRDFAEAARVFAQRAKLGVEAVNHATEIKLMAERRLADVVDAGQAAGAIARHGGARRDFKRRSPALENLDDLGVNHRRLAEARAIRDTMSEADISATVATKTAAGRPVSRDAIVKDAARTIRQRTKATRVAEIEATDPADLSTLDAYPVILADPPWQYDHSETSTRTVENHYPTMTMEAIAALEVPVADDSVLFLWATSPKLIDALYVLASWGFEYRTCMVWIKDKIGMGYYARQQHELLLIGKRGTLPVPDPEDRPPSIFDGKRSRHSEKPEVVYELIERMYPTRERCELFQRKPRKGWFGWGNQA